MIYICFAAAPFHLICIKEYLLRDKINNYIIYVILSNNGRINLEIKKTLKILNLKNVKPIEFSNIKIIQIFQRYLYASNIFLKYKNYNTVILIFHFRNTFMHLLRIFFKNSKFVLIDDGFQTFIDYKDYLIKKIYFPYNNFKSLIRKMFFFLFFGNNLRYLLFRKIDIFTIYSNCPELPKEYINSFKFLKKKLKIKYSIKNSNNIVYFIGGKMSERGAITLKQELNLIIKIKQYWEKKGKKLFYVSKRSASLTKLDIIRNVLKIDIVNFKLPIELVFAQKKVKNLPIICTLGSTLNMSLPLIYRGIRLYHVDMSNYYKGQNYDELNKDFKLSIHSSLADAGKVKIINL